MVRKKVQDALSKAMGTNDIKLLTPKNSDHGDYAFYARSVEKQVKTTDLENELFSDIERVGDFINLTISPIVLTSELATILEQKDNYGSSKKDKPKKISLEYGQPNTHKLPHIGHLFSYIYGESLARLLSITGNKVFRANYQGDVGLHVAKCLSQMALSDYEEIKNNTLEERIRFLQKCYQKGAQLYEDSESEKQKIDDLNKKIYTDDDSISALWHETRQWCLDYYQLFEKQLGITYDKYYFETQTAPVGKQLVKENIGTIFEESDGAIIFRGDRFGLHTRVFINKFDNPTYEAKDLGLVSLKKKDWPFDLAIITTASEQNEYFKVVIKAMQEVFPDLVGKISHIGFGMVDLKVGKMSSRTGNIISAIDLVETVRKEVHSLSQIKESVPHIAHAAIKYTFLRSEAHKNIAFDINESISTQGNSGPYLLYAYARTKSVIARSETTKQSQGLPRFARNDKMEPEELSLLRTFFRFPEVVDDAAKHYAPHLIATYLFDLAQKFNLFYEKHQILKAEDDIKQFRLALTAATAQLLKNGLYLLGIEVLEKI